MTGIEIFLWGLMGTAVFLLIVSMLRKPPWK